MKTDDIDTKLSWNLLKTAELAQAKRLKCYVKRV
jgi:hypothetical protein